MISLAFMWVKDNWRLLGSIGLILLVFGSGYYKGYQHEKAKYDAHLIADKVAVAVAKAEFERQIRAQQEVTNTVSKEYSDAVNKINDYYKSHPNVVRLCRDQINSSSMPSTSQSTSGISATTQGTTEVVTEIDLLTASKEIAQCQALIKFELEQDRIQ